MKIAMFSINPQFPEYITGGASKHLKNVAIYLGAQGHQVVLYCTRSEGSSEPFRWHENVEVRPVLRFHQPFPMPYGVPAYDMASILQDVGDGLRDADRFYMHDGELLFPFAYQHIPTVVSLRDNVYPETILGGFLFQSHRLILISEYSRQYYEATVGRFFPELPERVEVVHNGLDWSVFKPTPPSDELLALLPFDPAQHVVVLHPHRPEPTKGIPQTLAVVDLLVHEYGISNLRVLIPRWLDVQLTPDLQAFYDEVQAQVHRRALQQHVVFHPWLPQHLLPGYYSLGAVTLSLGSFPESFGNAVYESLGCGTPSIAARIATHRELLPDDLIDKVDYDDADSAARIAADIIRSGRRTSPETLRYLHEHYSMEHQLARYADLILNAEVMPPMQYRHPTIDETTRFWLAPWCYINAAGMIYHDFRADYTSLDALTPLLIQSPAGITFEQAQAVGVGAETIQHWLREGYLVPVH